MPKIWRKYTGAHIPSKDDVLVIVDHYEGPSMVRSRPLSLSLDLVSHSPTGFAWGRENESGAAQLALAIMFDHMMLQTGNPRLARERALDTYQEFKRKKIASLKWEHNFVITTDQIEKMLSTTESSA